MTEKRKISRDEYMKALALFVCANSHYARSREFERELAKIVGDPGEEYYCGHISDAIYIDDRSSVAQFNAALVQAGFEVVDEHQ